MKLENKLDDTNMIIKRMELFLMEQRDILQSLEVEIYKQQLIIREGYNIISHMFKDIHQVSQKLLNPSILRTFIVVSIMFTKLLKNLKDVNL